MATIPSKKIRYELRRSNHHRYGLEIAHVETGAIVGRYYATSEESARRHCEELNSGKCRARIDPPEHSKMTFTEAIAEARRLGDSTPGDGWRRLLWRMADLLESEE